jgi:hypothetical protein
MIWIRLDAPEREEFVMEEIAQSLEDLRDSGDLKSGWSIGRTIGGESDATSGQA